MNEENNAPDFGADAPTIVGKQAEEIKEAVSASEDMDATKVLPKLPEINREEDLPDDDGNEDDFDDFSEESETVYIQKNETRAKAQETKNDDFTNPQPETMKKHFWKTAGKILAVIGGAAAVSVIALFIIASVKNPSNTVARNVWVGDLNTGGLSYEDALAAIEASDLMSTKKIKLKCNDKYYVFDGADVGSAANAEETAKSAFNYGKSGNFLKDGFSGIKLLFSKKVLPPFSELNTDMLAEVLQRFGTDIYGELKQHSVEFPDNTAAVVTPGHTGFDGDVSTALKEVEEAFSKAQYDCISVTLKSAPPDDFTIETFDNICYKDPVDAYYEVKNNTVNIIPEQNGRYIKKDEAEAYLPLIKEGGEAVSVPVYPAYADITAEMLKEKLFADTLGSYSTYYGSSNSNRRANVARAASLMNGKVLAPGEVFSFNDTVGPRTVGNGFYTAKEYVNGESVDGIGGGTCQVSTTLYSAVLYADMGIVQRENHMMTIGYAPLGQDATVAYGSVDFKFKNTSDAPIKLVTRADGSNITVSVIGTAWNPAREVKLFHTTSQSGENTVVQSVRKVYSNNELISTDKLGTSVYKPHK